MYRHIIICCTCLLGSLFFYTPLVVAFGCGAPCPEGQSCQASCDANGKCNWGCYSNGGGGGGGGGGGSGATCYWSGWGACIGTCGTGTQYQANMGSEPPGADCGAQPSRACDTGIPCCNPNTWGAWSTCSKTCGGGTQMRTNACGTVITQACNTQVCYVTPTPTKVPTSTPVPSSTPVPTILPTSTLTPTSTLVPCTRKIQGDANCDGKIDGIDYSIWLNAQCHPTISSQRCGDLRADFNSDGNGDDNDFQIWYQNRGT